MNRITQTYCIANPILSWKETGELKSSIKLPYAPQFWVEAVEGITNWLIRLFRLREPLDKEIFSYNEITIDRCKVGSAVTEHFMEFIDQRGEPPACILMGRDIFHPLIGEIQQQLSFNASFHIRKQTRYSTLDFRGVRVVCIPWMNGMIALPELREELCERLPNY